MGIPCFPLPRTARTQERGCLCAAPPCTGRDMGTWDRSTSGGSCAASIEVEHFYPELPRDPYFSEAGPFRGGLTRGVEKGGGGRPFVPSVCSRLVSAASQRCGAMSHTFGDHE